jgi:hypothetical protein
MRTVEEIKADIASCRTDVDQSTNFGKAFSAVLKGAITDIEEELRAALSFNISLDRLEEICTAEREGRCYTPPCKVGNTVYWYTGVSIREEICKGFCVDTQGNLRFVFKDFKPIISCGSWYLTPEAAEAKLREGDSCG